MRLNEAEEVRSDPKYKVYGLEKRVFPSGKTYIVASFIPKSEPQPKVKSGALLSNDDFKKQLNGQLVSQVRGGPVGTTHIGDLYQIIDSDLVKKNPYLFIATPEGLNNSLATEMNNKKYYQIHRWQAYASGKNSPTAYGYRWPDYRTQHRYMALAELPELNGDICRIQYTVEGGRNRTVEVYVHTLEKAGEGWISGFTIGAKRVFIKAETVKSIT